MAQVTQLRGGALAGSVYGFFAGPSAPANLAATGVPFGVNLSWADDAGDQEGFRIERSDDGATFAQVAQVGADVRAYADAGLPDGRTYYYRVRAFNSFGNSPYGNVAHATTLPAPPGSGGGGAAGGLMAQHRQLIGPRQPASKPPKRIDYKRKSKRDHAVAVAALYLAGE